jgi:hypothetical protein
MPPSKQKPPFWPPPPEGKEVFPTPDEFDYKKPAVEFTYERRMRFLYELRRTGLKHRAAELVGVSTSAVDTARKKEPAFDEAVRQAKDRYVDEVLVTAATKRAVEGVPKPIIGGRWRDEIITHETVYSDALLSLLLKSARPEFRESSADPSKYDLGTNAGVVVIPASPTTPQEWEEKFGAGSGAAK